MRHFLKYGRADVGVYIDLVLGMGGGAEMRANWRHLFCFYFLGSV